VAARDGAPLARPVGHCVRAAVREPEATTVPDKEQPALRHPAGDQPYEVPRPLGQLVMYSPPFSMGAFRGAEDRQKLTFRQQF
jgi:hypothetical protein